VAPGRRAADRAGRGRRAPKDWPSTYLGPRDWKSRLVRSRTLELTWESDAQRRRTGTRWPAAGCPRATCSAGASPSLPAARTGRLAEARRGWSGRGRPDRPRLRPGPRLAELLARPATPSVSSSSRLTAAPPPGAIASIERSLNGGFAGGPDGLVVSPTGSCSAPSASAGRRPSGGSSRATSSSGSRPATSSSTSTTASRATSRCSGAAAVGRGARLPGAELRRRRPDLRPRGADRPGQPLLGRRAPAAEQARRDGLAAHQAAGQEGGRRTWPRSCSSCTPPGPAPRATPSRPTPRGRPRWRRASRTRRPPDQLRAAAEVKADMESRRPMDRLVVGDVGYGKTEVALRAAFKAIQDGKQVAVLVPTTVLAAQHDTDLQPALRGVPDDGPHAQPVRAGPRAGHDDRGPRRRARWTWSSAPTGCSARTSSSATWAWWWSTRSSASASRPRSASSSCGARWTC
jgi:hypothetical protein